MADEIDTFGEMLSGDNSGNSNSSSNNGSKKASGKTRPLTKRGSATQEVEMQTMPPSVGVHTVSNSISAKDGRDSLSANNKRPGIREQHLGASFVRRQQNSGNETRSTVAVNPPSGLRSESTAQ